MVVAKTKTPLFSLFLPFSSSFFQPPTSRVHLQLNSVRYGVYHLLSIPLVNFKVIAKKETNRKLRPEN